MTGMLTGSEIYKQVKNGRIEITPFAKERINPNSYNLRLDDHLKIYEPPIPDEVPDGSVYSVDDNWNYKIWSSPKSITYETSGTAYLDLHKQNETEDMWIDHDKGIILYPGKLYLGTTIERTHTDFYVPMLNGRSSVGRKGLTIHVTAGFGDIGFDGKWTLEMTVVHPLKIYYGDEICQISFFDIDGDNYYLYNGRYQKQDDVVESRFEEEKKGMFTDER